VVAMIKLFNWLTILVLCVSIQVVLAESIVIESQDVLKREVVLGERNGGVYDDFTPFEIEEILNIYGSTAAGKSPSNAQNNLPYEEMGVYGVEYENIFIDDNFMESGVQILETQTDKKDAGVSEVISQ
jgi:hypothetical protein